MKNCLLFLFFCSLSFSTYAQGNTGSTDGTEGNNKKKDKVETTDKKPDKTYSDWKSYSNNNTTIQYPKSWLLDESGRMGTSFFLFSPVVNDQDLFKENMNLLIIDLTQYGLADMALKEYVDLSIAQLPNIIDDYTFKSSTESSKNGRSYYQVQYTGSQMNYELRWMQQIWLVNSKAYVLSFTAENDQFYNYKGTAQKIFDSFKIK